VDHLGQQGAHQTQGLVQLAKNPIINLLFNQKENILNLFFLNLKYFFHFRLRFLKITLKKYIFNRFLKMIKVDFLFFFS